MPQFCQIDHVNQSYIMKTEPVIHCITSAPLNSTTKGTLIITYAQQCKTVYNGRLSIKVNSNGVLNTYVTKLALRSYNIWL